MNQAPEQAHAPSKAAALALVVWASLTAAACSSPTEPDPGPIEPDPFPNARSVRLWIYATGLVLEPSETVELGFWVDEPDASYERYRCPPNGTYSCPTQFRSVWWTSDPGVVSVDSAGVLRAVAPGEAAVWVQVESERDSALVRVASPGDASGPRYTNIQAGGSHTCALDERGATHCWGWDIHGALGRGAARWWTRAGAPGRVVGGQALALLVAGDAHTCGLVAGGEAWCWGRNSYGQVGNGLFDTNRPLPSEAGVPEPVLVVGGFQFDTLVAADETTCGLASGAAYCWGWNFRGELGIGSPDPLDSRAEPTPVTGGLTFRLLAAGEFHVCGVTTSDETYCWGEHNLAAVSSGEGRVSNAPVLVDGAPPFVALTGGLGFTCGLTAAPETYCWGYNDSGQLGHATLEGSGMPTLLAGGFGFVALAAGTMHTCGLTAGGEAYCWGENEYGQLGTGERNFEPNPEPRSVAGGLSFQILSAGNDHTCGITIDGAAYCWGVVGLLGDGKVPEILPPFGAGVPFSAVPVRVVAPMG